MAEINQLTPLSRLTPLRGEEKKADGFVQEEGVFGAIFQGAINNVKETDADKVEAPRSARIKSRWIC